MNANGHWKSLGMSLAFLLGALGSSCFRSASNVILITLDTTRTDRFKPLGYIGGPARPAGAGPARH